MKNREIVEKISTFSDPFFDGETLALPESFASFSSAFFYAFAFLQI